jgi:hypothetical protein
VDLQEELMKKLIQTRQAAWVTERQQITVILRRMTQPAVLEMEVQMEQATHQVKTQAHQEE